MLSSMNDMPAQNTPTPSASGNQQPASTGVPAHIKNADPYNTFSTPPPEPPRPKSGRPPVILILFMFIIVLTLGGGGVYYYYTTTQSPIGTNTTTPTPTPSLSANETEAPTQTPSPTIEASASGQWKEVRYGGLFSYEYPDGWHVAELWGLNLPTNGIMLAIDPNPISTAPRGGPLAKIELVVTNGQQNPDEILDDERTRFSPDNYNNIVTETIPAEHGDVYFYTGEIAGVKLGGTVVERYVFMLHESADIPQNQQIITATTYPTTPEDSQRLRHIVESFREL